MLTDLRKYSDDSVQPVVNTKTLAEVTLPSYLRDKIELCILKGELKVNPHTAFSKTKTANYAVMPNQIFRFACQVYDAAFDIISYFNALDQINLKKNPNHFFSEDSNEIKEKFLQQNLSGLSEADCDMLAKFVCFQSKGKNPYRLGGKSIFNKNERTGEITVRSNADCFGSIVLTLVNLPNSSSSIFGDIVYSLVNHKELYDELRDYFSKIKVISDLPKHTSDIFSLPKPFLLLAGISGTGKTRFVRKQAEASGDLSETYCLTSVRPDWHEPSDLLGYVSRLGVKAEYVTTDVLQFIAKAWRAIASSGLSIDVENGQLIVQGDRSELNSVKPYWLCLDEMNLAPVEQYFADYLSVLETREWKWKRNDDTFDYKCDPLLKSVEINAVDQEKLKNELGFTSEQDEVLWNQIVKSGLPIPFNLIVAGTVNMDETTHGFSRKVIDRALSFDFGEYFPNDFDAFYDQQYVNKTLSYPLHSHSSRDELINTCDPEGSQTIAFLKAINLVLRQTPFELAYRAVNELLLAVISTQPKDELTLKAVWDDFVMCKVLPRIEGDSDKLSTASGDNLLAELLKVIDEELLHEDKARPDLYREKKSSEAENGDKVLSIPFKSKIKLEWMKQRLDNASFTSFWP